MYKLFVPFALILTVACAPEEAPILAETAQDNITRTAEGRPDLSGVWQALSSAHWNLEPHAASQGASEVLGAIGAVPPGIGIVDQGTIPYLPEAKAQRDRNFANRRTEDPEAKCFRAGVPRANYMPYPFQIFQTESEVFIAYQYALASRSIMMANPMEAPFDSWMGWSNGHWEGDTLVVEVSGQNGQSWLDRAGNFASENIRVIERFTPISADHLMYEATIEDSTVFTRPWKISLPLYRRIEKNSNFLEFKCIEFAEELMFSHLKKGADEGAEND